MSYLKMTLNGRPPKEHRLDDLLEGALLELAVEKIEAKISKAVTAEEAGQIVVKLSGRDASDLFVQVRGPRKIVKKVKGALE